RQQVLERPKIPLRPKSLDRPLMLLPAQPLAALQSLDPSPAALADPKGGAGLPQRLIGRVEIDADQLVAVVGAGGRGGQDRLQVARRGQELQLDLMVLGQGALP